MYTIERYEPNKFKLSTRILTYAYMDHVHAGHRFNEAKICGFCGSEYMFINEGPNGKIHICQNCGARQPEREIKAA